MKADRPRGISEQRGVISGQGMKGKTHSSEDRHKTQSLRWRHGSRQGGLRVDVLDGEGGKKEKCESEEFSKRRMRQERKETGAGRGRTDRRER